MSVDVTNKGVDWETVVRWAWDGTMKIELRATTETDVEIVVTFQDSITQTLVLSRSLRIDDVRAALDTIEHSAKEVECLS